MKTLISACDGDVEPSAGNLGKSEHRTWGMYDVVTEDLGSSHLEVCQLSTQ